MNTFYTMDFLPSDVVEEKIKKAEQQTSFAFPSALKELLIKHNVFKLHKCCYKSRSVEFTIDYFFGFSTKHYWDIMEVYKTYLNRMPKEVFPVASVDGGDLLCMHKDTGEIYYWFHEEDDLGLEGINKWPAFIASDINTFIDQLILPILPTKDEIMQAKKHSKITITPKSVEIRNIQRIEQGLPPLSMEEWDKLLNSK